MEGIKANATMSRCCFGRSCCEPYFRYLRVGLLFVSGGGGGGTNHVVSNRDSTGTNPKYNKIVYGSSTPSEQFYPGTVYLVPGTRYSSST